MPHMHFICPHLHDHVDDSVISISKNLLITFFFVCGVIGIPLGEKIRIQASATESKLYFQCYNIKS